MIGAALTSAAFWNKVRISPGEGRTHLQVSCAVIAFSQETWPLVQRGLRGTSIRRINHASPKTFPRSDFGINDVRDGHAYDERSSVCPIGKSALQLQRH